MVEVLERHPGGDVQKAVVNMTLEIRREVRISKRYKLSSERM